MPFEKEIKEYEELRRKYQASIVNKMSREEYISALRLIRTEATDEHLIRFFFKTAMQRMQEEMDQKEANTKRFMTFLF